MWKRNFNFFPSYILDPIYRAGKFIPGWKRHSIELMSYRREHDVDNLIEEYTPLSFTKEEEVYGKNMLAEFGIKGKFICLAVRDEEYQKKKIASRFRDWSYHEYRNHDVDNFILASEELVRRGYHVIRMGVVVKKSINSNNPKIIDYANSSLRSDFMDVYLGAKCSFCISTGFGFDFVPYIFKKPVLRMCLPVGDIQSYSKKFLTVTNNHVTKKDQRKLSMSEIFSKGLGYAYDTKIYREKGVELIDFTPEEIKEMAVEMLETYELKNVSDQESKKLQNAFNSIFASNIKHYDHRKGSKDAIWKLHGEIRSLFSAKFLSKNKHWLK